MTITATYDEATIDNLLVGQKDKIINILNDAAELADTCCGYDAAIDRLQAAWAMVDLVAPLWKQVGYSYKTVEICKRADALACHLNMKLRSPAKLERVTGYLLAFRNIQRENS